MKKIGIVLIIFTLIGFAGTFYLEGWLSKKIPEIINTNPDRNYDVLFEDLEISFFQQAVELQTIVLVPLNDSLASKMNGSLRSILMRNVNFVALIFDNKLEIGEIKLIEPAFRLIQRDRTTSPNESSLAFQELFQDLISRGEIRNFILEKGTAEMFIENDSLYRFGQFTDLSIIAHGIETDSIIANYAIPFKLKSIVTSLKNLKIITDYNQEFRIADASFNSSAQTASLKGISLKYNNQILGALAETEFQKDLLQLEIKEFGLSQIDTKSTIYGNWSIFAGIAEIDSLSLEDLRDKNKPRPDEPIKPLFEGMVENIPFPIKLDSVKISNSTLTYKEIPSGKTSPIVLNFQDINGSLTNLISTDSLQKDAQMKVNVSSNLNGYAPVSMRIDVPYGKNTFELEASMAGFDMVALNEVFEPLGKFRVESGTLKRLKLNMDANENGSSNQVIFDYQNLKLEILNSDGSKNIKNGILSKITNIMTSRENLPENNGYKISKHWTKRNPYRAPFNLIWISTKEGLMAIVPSGLGNIFISDNKK
ncbi:DUF748 domain-containing protein [Algoriphagus sp. SE2]|uniref:DUF748 domain-containing protein n=1 Tax=Algoriphagus sp. SE2 TaxID=3141536 RepID=UPI0031CD533D